MLEKRQKASVCNLSNEFFSIVTTNKVHVYNIYKDQFGYMNNVLFTSKEDVLSSDKMILEVERNKFGWLYKE